MTVTAGCGASTTENCTYFESPSSATTVNGGPCRLKACKCSSNICQMRLDFITFVISGPSTLTGSIGETLHGTFTTVAAAGAGADVTNAGQKQEKQGLHGCKSVGHLRKNSSLTSNYVFVAKSSLSSFVQIWNVAAE